MDIDVGQTYESRRSPRADGGREARIELSASWVGSDTRRQSHQLPLATPGMPPNPLPPITSYSASGLLLATDWKRALRCAGHPCDVDSPCHWSTGMGELFRWAADARPYVRNMLESSAARGAPESTLVSHVAPVDILALPVRNFAPVLSSAEAVAAVDTIAHGDGDEPWWMAAKASEDCGGFLLPLPRNPEGTLLVVFRRFEDRLRIWGPAERIDLTI